MLADEGRYVHSQGDANWWMRSGRVFLSPGADDDPAAELAHARQHFFLPHRFRDPFHRAGFDTESVVSYDAYDLLDRGNARRAWTTSSQPRCTTTACCSRA